MIKKVRYAPSPTYQERFYMLSLKYTVKSLVLPIQNFSKVTTVTWVNEININPKLNHNLRQCFTN